MLSPFSRIFFTHSDSSVSGLGSIIFHHGIYESQLLGEIWSFEIYVAIRWLHTVRRPDGLHSVIRARFPMGVSSGEYFRAESVTMWVFPQCKSTLFQESGYERAGPQRDNSSEVEHLLGMERSPDRIEKDYLQSYSQTIPTMFSYVEQCDSLGGYLLWTMWFKVLVLRFFLPSSNFYFLQWGQSDVHGSSLLRRR